MRVDVWSDLVCPFCWIGITHFRRGLALLGSDAPKVELRWRAFMLDPDADATPVPLAEAYAQKFGGEDQARAMFERVESAGREAGLPIDLGRGQVRVTTLPAHRLMWLARQQQADVDAVADALFHAHFAEGLSLADPATLVRAGAAGGLAEESVHALLAGADGEQDVRNDMGQARQIGISAVPFFVLDGRLAVRGAQPPEAFADAIRQALALPPPSHLTQ
ncbi:DsbA family oxidoreductase [Luteimonas sp. MJ293]|uniref:DsbA family oxidoreductase n=1 Tax=Luteimonas sp. MJ146 TaxID=3129240 RepID=UPI0031BA1AC3